METSLLESRRCHHLWRSSRLTTTSLVHSLLIVSKVGIVSVYMEETQSLYANGDNDIYCSLLRFDEPAESGAEGEYST